MTSSLRAPSTPHAMEFIFEKVKKSMFYAKVHVITVQMSAVVCYTPQGLTIRTEHGTGA